MAEVEKARQVIETERADVEATLKALRRREDRENARHAKVMREVMAEAHLLAIRGKGAGMTVVAMAQALDVTRQRMHNIIREAEDNAVVSKFMEHAKSGTIAEYLDWVEQEAARLGRTEKGGGADA